MQNVDENPKRESVLVLHVAQKAREKTRMTYEPPSLILILRRFVFTFDNTTFGSIDATKK
jgi:hypothetical protein